MHIGRLNFMLCVRWGPHQIQRPVTRKSTMSSYSAFFHSYVITDRSFHAPGERTDSLFFQCIPEYSCRLLIAHSPSRLRQGQKAKTAEWIVLLLVCSPQVEWDPVLYLLFKTGSTCETYTSLAAKNYAGLRWCKNQTPIMHFGAAFGNGQRPYVHDNCSQ